MTRSLPYAPLLTQRIAAVADRCRVLAAVRDGAVRSLRAGVRLVLRLLARPSIGWAWAPLWVRVTVMPGWATITMDVLDRAMQALTDEACVRARVVADTYSRRLARQWPRLTRADQYALLGWM